MCKMPYIKVARRENDLVLTTPKRIELLKDGPPESGSNRCHILGRGAYGTVFKAIYRGRTVALKIIKSSAISTLHNEAHVLNWKHRNIVRLLKLESTPEFGLLIMERPSGLCLQRVIDTLPLPLMHRVLITLDILSGLRYCHCQQVLHLDVKPPNILIALGTRPSSIGRQRTYHRCYICKICDFGSSIKLDGENCGQSGGVKGTLRYMSPEALRSSALSCATDIYSLGITMWQLQARRLPFHTLNCNETIAYQVVKHELRPDNYALLEELKQGSEQAETVPLVSCYCNERGESIRYNSVDILRSYMSSINSPLDVLLTSDLYKKPRRNLNFDATHGRVAKRSRRQPRLAHYFDSLGVVTASAMCLEREYTRLYKGCWGSQVEMRLSSQQLQKQLQQLLTNCFVN